MMNHRGRLKFGFLLSLLWVAGALGNTPNVEVRGHKGEKLDALVRGDSVTLMEFRRGKFIKLIQGSSEAVVPLSNPLSPTAVRLGQRSVTVNFLPPNFPRYQFKGRSTVGNPIIFSASRHDDAVDLCHLLVLSPLGAVEYYRQLHFPCVDFRPHTIEGRQFYSYHRTKSGVSGLGFVGFRTILDEEFRPIHDLTTELDHHDFLLFGLRHWTGIELKLGRLKSGMAYYDKRVREWDNGKLVFDWGVADFMRQFDTETAALIRMTEWRGEIVADILHINSVQRVGDDGYLVGLGTNGVAYVERSGPRVKWVLGGLNDQFGLTHAQHPHFNHTAYFDSKRQELLLFSNGRLFDGTTQVLRYYIDVDKKRLKRFEVLRNENELSTLLGSVQAVDGTLNVSFGVRARGNYDFVELRDGRQTAGFTMLGPHAIPYRVYRAPMGDD